MREMKNSGMVWIGEIPNHWKVEKFKYHMKRNEKKNRPDATVLSLYRELGIIPKDSRDDNHNVTSEDTSKYKFVEIGNFVVNKMKAWQGSVAVSDYEGIVSPAYYVYQFTDTSINKRYLHYLLRGCYKDEFRRMSGGVRIGQWDLPADRLENTLILIPPTNEQAKIADFLDDKCVQLDALISDIQTQIDTLEEIRRSTIARAVIKGLITEVSMKDSKIEWVGSVPAHWDIRPLYCYFGERKHKNSLGKEQNLLSLSYGKIVRKDINTNGGLLPASFNTYNIIEAGDIIIRPTDLQNDKRSLRTGYAWEHGIITSAYIALKPIADVNTEYMHYLLHAYDVMKVFYNMGNGVRQGLNFDEFKRLIVLEPPRKEQDMIVGFLNEKCAEIEAVIADKKSQLETLNNYKKSIIFEYVTGKKEVV